MQFLKVGDTLINLDRLLVVQHKPEVSEGIRSNEHYRAVFDTGQELWLTPKEGERVVNHRGFICGNGSEGTIATTSESST
jgi:hypothetical protein